MSIAYSRPDPRAPYKLQLTLPLFILCGCTEGGLIMQTARQMGRYTLLGISSSSERADEEVWSTTTSSTMKNDHLSSSVTLTGFLMY